MTKSLISTVLGGLVLGLVITTASIAFESDLVRGMIGGDRVIVAAADPAEDRLRSMLAEGECWTGAAPDGAVPARVWINYGLDGGGEATYRLQGARTTGMVLEVLFDGDPATNLPEGTAVAAFCSAAAEGTRSA